MKLNIGFFLKAIVLPSFLSLGISFLIYVYSFNPSHDVLQGYLNSSLFPQAIIILVGLIAVLLYKKKKEDEKISASNIILLEIQNAEKKLKTILQSVSLPSPVLPENVFLLPTETWSKYRHLFVKDFDEIEWDAITDFYEKCQLYDEAVKYNNSFFQKNEEQIRVNYFQVLSQYVKEYSEKTLPSLGLTQQQIEKENIIRDEKIKRFDEIHIPMLAGYLYSPVKPKNNAKTYLSTIGNANLSLSTVGLKLKKIAEIE